MRVLCQYESYPYTADTATIIAVHRLMHDDTTARRKWNCGTLHHYSLRSTVLPWQQPPQHRAWPPYHRWTAPCVTTTNHWWMMKMSTITVLPWQQPPQHRARPPYHHSTAPCVTTTNHWWWWRRQLSIEWKWKKRCIIIFRLRNKRAREIANLKNNITNGWWLPSQGVLRLRKQDNLAKLSNCQPRWKVEAGLSCGFTSTWHKIRHFGDVLTSRSLGLVLTN